MDIPTSNAPGHLGTLNLLKQHEAGAEVQVAETFGDIVYSDGCTRQVSADAGRKLAVRLPEHPNAWEHHGHAMRSQVFIPPSECSSM